MSLQLTIAKILAGQPGRRATVGTLNEAILMLYRSGPQWTDRIKRLSKLAPDDLDLFTQGLVIRYDDSWQLTKEGRVFIEALEELDQVHTLVSKRRVPSTSQEGSPMSAVERTRRIA